jgi:hypothetical protein
MDDGLQLQFTIEARGTSFPANQNCVRQTVVRISRERSFVQSGSKRSQEYRPIPDSVGRRVIGPSVQFGLRGAHGLMPSDER